MYDEKSVQKNKFIFYSYLKWKIIEVLLISEKLQFMLKIGEVQIILLIILCFFGEKGRGIS